MNLFIKKKCTNLIIKTNLIIIIIKKIYLLKNMYIAQID